MDYLQCKHLLGRKRLLVQGVLLEVWTRKVDIAVVGGFTKNGHGVQQMTKIWTHQPDCLGALHQAQQVVVRIIV